MDNFGNHNPELKNKIYLVYLSIFDLPVKTQKKNSIMTPLIGGYEDSWRVIGITINALELLAKNSYKYKTGSICRAHINSRIDTARKLFERNKPVSEPEFFEIVWRNDKTVIATKNENKNNGVLPQIIPINYMDKLFSCKAVVGFNFGKAESQFLEDLHKKYLNNEIELKSPYEEIK